MATGFDDLAYSGGVDARSWLVLRGSAGGFQSPAVDTGLGTDSDRQPGDLPPTSTATAGATSSCRAAAAYCHRLRRIAVRHAMPTASIGVANPASCRWSDRGGHRRRRPRRSRVRQVGIGDAIFWRRNQSGTYPSFGAEAALWSAAGRHTADERSVRRDRAALPLRSVRSGDFNGDGRVDLLVRAQQSVSLRARTAATGANRWLAARIERQHPGARSTRWTGRPRPCSPTSTRDALTDIGYWNAVRAVAAAARRPAARGATLATFGGPHATAALMHRRLVAAPWSSTGTATVGRTSCSRHADGQLHYCRSAGSSLEACQPSGISAAATCRRAPITLDANGDSLPGSAARDQRGAAAPAPRRCRPISCVAITDGLGLRTQFEYAPLTNRHGASGRQCRGLPDARLRTARSCRDRA
ncbi:MAG: hypothetical protein MZW92_13780 [Comamonadaceae bacterium]|nr:hypothetical protein [Comamonadaceae bacterium]